MFISEPDEGIPNLIDKIKSFADEKNSGEWAQQLLSVIDIREKFMSLKPETKTLLRKPITNLALILKSDNIDLKKIISEIGEGSFKEIIALFMFNESDTGIRNLIDKIKNFAAANAEQKWGEQLLSAIDILKEFRKLPDETKKLLQEPITNLPASILSNYIRGENINLNDIISKIGPDSFKKIIELFMFNESDTGIRNLIDKIRIFAEHSSIEATENKLLSVIKKIQSAITSIQSINQKIPLQRFLCDSIPLLEISISNYTDIKIGNIYQLLCKIFNDRSGKFNIELFKTMCKFILSYENHPQDFLKKFLFQYSSLLGGVKHLIEEIDQNNIAGLKPYFLELSNFASHCLYHLDRANDDTSFHNIINNSFSTRKDKVTCDDTKKIDEFITINETPIKSFLIYSNILYNFIPSNNHKEIFKSILLGLLTIYKQELETLQRGGKLSFFKAIDGLLAFLEQQIQEQNSRSDFSAIIQEQNSTSDSSAIIQEQNSTSDFSAIIDIAPQLSMLINKDGIVNTLLRNKELAVSLFLHYALNVEPEILNPDMYNKLSIIDPKQEKALIKKIKDLNFLIEAVNNIGKDLRSENFSEEYRTPEYKEYMNITLSDTLFQVLSMIFIVSSAFLNIADAIEENTSQDNISDLHIVDLPLYISP